MSIRHKDVNTTHGIHAPFSYVFNSEAERMTPPVGGYVTADLGKIAWQTDDNSLWMLVDSSPTWTPVGLTALANLNDVELSETPTSGQALVYDPSGKWTNKTIETATYVSNPLHWEGTAPATMEEAINRLAAALSTHLTIKLP